MQIYTTGGGYFVEEILIFLAMFHASNDFDVMMLIGITAGMTAMASMMIFGMGFQSLFKTFVIMALAGSLFLGKTVSVDVHDKTYGTLSYYSTVDNVPFGVAMLAHYTTGLSYYVTEKMEQLLSTPTDLAYQKNGMVFGATLMAQQARWRAVNSVINERLVEFLEKCMIRGSNLRYFSTDVIARATDIEAAVSANLPASLSYFDNKTGSVQSCQAGWADIQTDITAEVGEILKHKAASLYQRNPGVDGPATVANLTNSLAALQNMVGASSATATNTVKQAMMINALDDSIQRYAALSGNDASLTNLSNTIAEAQRRSAYASIGAAAQKWVPYLKIVFEVLYYGFFPFAVMLMFTPLAITVFKGYCGGFIWLASWEPTSAILHGIVLRASSGFYRSAGIQTSDGQPTDVAMTWANHFGFIATEQEIGATAGMLMMSVPFITTAILFGARQMTQLATSMLNVGQGTAIEAGRMAATGNVSLANASMNNMSANTWDTASRVDTERWSATSPTGAIIGQNSDGSYYHNKGTSVPDVPLSVSADRAIRAEASVRAEESRTAVQTTASETSAFVSEAASRFAGLTSQATENTNFGSQRNTSLSQDDSTSLREAQRVLDNAASQAGVSSDVIIRGGISGRIGLDAKQGETLEEFEKRSANARRGGNSINGETFGEPEKASVKASGGAGANVSGEMVAQSRENYSRAWEAAQSEEVQRALATIERVGESSHWGVSGNYGQSGNAGERFSIDQGERLSQSLSKQLREADAYSRAASDLNTSGVVTSSQLGVFAQRALEDQGMTPQQVSSILTARDFGALAQQDAVLEEVMSDMVSNYRVGGSATDRTQGYAAGSLYAPQTPSSLPDTVAPVRDHVVGETIATDNRIGEAEDRLSNGQTVQKENFDQHYHANTLRNEQGQNRSLREVNRERMTSFGEQLNSKFTGTPLYEEPPLPPPMPLAGQATLPDMSTVVPQAPALSWQASGTGPFQRTIDGQGFYHGPNVSYDLEGKTRDNPPNPELMDKVSNVASTLGPDIGVVVTSAGQPAAGEGPRVGSDRHDHGNAVDFYLTRNGEQVTPAQDPELYKNFIQQSSGSFPGIGHYDWGLHVGGGQPAFWGPDKTSSSADPDFLDAYNRGRRG